MAEIGANDFNSSLMYEAAVPLRWQISPPLASSEYAYVNQQNQELLEAILSLDETAIEAESDNHPLNQHYHRLNAKLNLLIALVAELVASSGLRPAPVALKLNATHLEWLQPGEAKGGPPDVGQYLRCEVYLWHDIPKPLVLFGDVTGATDVPGGPDHIQVALQLAGITEAVRERLEKFVFRWHRRRIAQSRHPAW